MVFALVLLSFSAVSAQIQLQANPESRMILPDIIEMESSATHLYVLSKSEGLVVFRTNTDTLQYMFTSEGMETRGNKMHADVRFAYLFGNGTRLTILEPTSLLGVYSSTYLTTEPKAVARVSTKLFVALGNDGLAKLDLSTPALFDNNPEIISFPKTGSVNDIVRMPLQLVALIGNSSLSFFDIDSEEISYKNSVELSGGVNHLHILDDVLYASDNNGNLFLVRQNGQLDRVFSAGDAISRVSTWNGYFIVRTNNGLLYVGKPGESAQIVRSNTESGNHFNVAQNKLWVSNYSELASQTFMSESSGPISANTGRFSIKPINNVVVPFPRPVLIPLFTEGADVKDIRFHYRSDAENAEIRGQGFYWQPQNSQIGITHFTILATNPTGLVDSTSFYIDVRAFNAPPRFNPMRPLTIVVGENFSLPIRAIDPDGQDTDLIRYHGVNLPDGASISERTGMFTWSPERRQVGMHEFQVIATDQYGAAASLNVNITVRNISRED